MIHPIVQKNFFEIHEKNNFIMIQGSSAAQNDLMRIVLDDIQKNTSALGSPGGTVAHCVASFLEFAGAGTIILLGQDLAYPGGKTHAEESFDGLDLDKEEFEKKIMARDMVTVEDVHGGTVQTDKAFSVFIEQFEGFAEMYKNKFTLVDATEGGAKIKNTKIMTLRDAIDTYMKEFTDPGFTAGIIEQAKSQGFLFNENEQTKIKHTLEKMLAECKNIIELTDDALEKGQRVLKLYRFNRIPTAKELDKPFTAFRISVEEITKNKMMHEVLASSWVSSVQEEIAFRNDEETEEYFYTRVTSYLLAQQKEGAEVLSEALKETIEKLKAEGDC
jgi:hypothetical protein